MTGQTVIATFWFNSETSNTIYETLVYSDGTTSCNCKGWTFRRVDAGGHRSCKHTRIVAAGYGEKMANNYMIKPAFDAMTAAKSTTKTNTPGVMMPKPGQRKLVIE